MNVEIDPRPEASTADLVREALDEAKQLVKIEIALAKDEVKRELVEAKRAAILFGVAAVFAFLAAALLLVSMALAIFPGPIPALALGLVLLVAAGVLGFVGYKKVPKNPLDQTRHRLENDVKLFKERIA